jgi:hypothetical protein
VNGQFDLAGLVCLQNCWWNCGHDLSRRRWHRQYGGEQWRNDSNTNAQKLAFSFRVNSSPITNSDAVNANSWTLFTNLDFTTPTTGSTADALDGNNAADGTRFFRVHRAP